MKLALACCHFITFLLRIEKCSLLVIIKTRHVLLNYPTNDVVVTKKMSLLITLQKRKQKRFTNYEMCILITSLFTITNI